MKTIEDRLRAEAFIPYSFMDPDDPVLLLSDALAIVADAPRIYRGEEIKELPYNTRGVDGLCESTGEMAWKEITIAGWSAALIDAHKEKGMTRLFLPLPTNSPSEGKG